MPAFRFYLCSGLSVIKNFVEVPKFSSSKVAQRQRGRQRERGREAEAESSSWPGRQPALGQHLGAAAAASSGSAHYAAVAPLESTWPGDLFLAKLN